ncbi:NADP-dependent oxidoreductase [Lysinibacter cavernae]|uniref:NADPH:quinone reductase-like Zn-dependent oxidoreductase n=1 Tax=Lysinibacter cavernae TaxID=1640652 RepID=A0A7X5R415_9MICO|nr:NADP-dependent oxidoreductase [Lysinibacter cavernae]NIH54920.1 NADPH:quinone reductase-like Zn-dependent oxidoreductase [Lysinibacter cavernae]
MRAVVYEEFGGPGVLQIVTVPDPETPVDNQVVIEVRAVGINPYDRKVRSGLVPLKDPKFPRGICSDFAGVVVEAGSEAVHADGSQILAGHEVMGWSIGGSLRELVRVRSAQLARKPASLDWTVAGSLTTPGLTAVAALETLNIGPNDTVLLSAASGSVGVLYAQLAIARGATVIGTASERNHDVLRAHGILPTTYGPGLADRVRAIAPEGITAVQDNAGRETVEAGLELGLPADRICSIVDYGAIAEFGIVSPGQYVRSAVTLGVLAQRAADGDLDLPIANVFPLDRVVDAFTLLESGHSGGKIVIAP